MKLARAGALIASVVLGVSLSAGAVSAQSETATAEDGKSASDAPAETSSAPEVPLGANLTPPLGALPPGPALISDQGSGQPGTSSVSMAPGTLTAGTAREGVNAVRAPEAAPAPAPAPVMDPAPEPVTDATVTEPSESVAADTAVISETDLDEDNYPDALEWDLGLDPNNIDTDADGVADGDEINIYSTEPTVYDTDGDGLSDGQELFDSRTNPLLWDDFTAATDDATAAQESTEAAQTLE